MKNDLDEKLEFPVEDRIPLECRIGIKCLVEVTKMSKPTIWRYRKSGNFPKTYRIFRKKNLYWDIREVEKWLTGKLNEKKQF